MVEEVNSPRLSKLIEGQQEGIYFGNFEARVRYLSSSLIVTIPVKVARELELKLGDRVIIQVRKKRKTLALATGQQSR
jgi:hypothetical protein